MDSIKEFFQKIDTTLSKDLGNTGVSWATGLVLLAVGLATAVYFGAINIKQNQW